MNADPDLLVSFVAGLLSFLSPCVLPLIPSFISYIGGVSLTELRSETVPRTRIVVRTVLFVIGFSTVFILLGVIFSGSGFFFMDASRVISIVAGIIVIVLGFNVIFDFIKVLNFEKRVHVTKMPRGYVGAFVIGMAFGGGWTPCVGPILAGILFLAGQSGEVLKGVLYLSVYSLGLGLPFLLASIFFIPFTRQMEKLKAYLTPIRIASGIFLIAIGVLIATGRFQQINASLLSWGYGLRTWSEENPSAARGIFTLISALIAAIPYLPAIIRSFTVSHQGTTAVRTKVLSVPKAVFSTVFLVIAILQLTGIIDLAAVLSSWLTFQGI